MALDSSKVLVLAPDQATIGPVFCGDVVTTIPADFAAAEALVNKMTKNSGYLSSDGLSLASDFSTSDINEWGGSIVRKVLESYVGSVNFTIIQTDATAWATALGDDHVTTSADGYRAALGSHLAPECGWGFKMKDGNNKLIVLIPRGQVTEFDEMSFVRTDALGLNLTVTSYDAGEGDSIYVYFTDGTTTTKASA